ncbi:mariner Mos1 transposase [Trichonephila clavipes]|nr:mariner Mos1 transposase [Trichonephila clavipes]
MLTPDSRPNRPRDRIASVARQCCVFSGIRRDQSIIYELLKPGETANNDRYKQQLLNLNDAILEKREQYKKRQHKVIFLDDNAPSHRAKPTKDIVNVLYWEFLAHASYSPGLVPSDYSPICIIGTRIG